MTKHISTRLIFDRPLGQLYAAAVLNALQAQTINLDLSVCCHPVFGSPQAQFHFSCIVRLGWREATDDKES